MGMVRGPVRPGLWLDRLRVEEGYRLADANLGSELEKFVINTLEYALKERHMILGGVSVPDIGVDIKGRQCLIAIRGANYLEDLEAVNSYIREARPTLIAVDGGADALIDRGFIPDIIIGDMDSVSDRALRCGAALVAHAYADGRSPGAERLKQAGLPHHVISCPGTSEDVAMLMAYQAGASLIVAVGSHSNMRDFLEKNGPAWAAPSWCAYWWAPSWSTPGAQASFTGRGSRPSPCCGSCWQHACPWRCCGGCRRRWRPWRALCG